MNSISILKVVCCYGMLPRKRFSQDHEYLKANNSGVCMITDPVVSLVFDCEAYEWWKTDIGPFNPAASLPPSFEGDFKN